MELEKLKNQQKNLENFNSDLSQYVKALIRDIETLSELNSQLLKENNLHENKEIVNLVNLNNEKIERNNEKIEKNIEKIEKNYVSIEQIIKQIKEIEAKNQISPIQQRSSFQSINENQPRFCVKKSLSPKYSPSTLAIGASEPQTLMEGAYIDKSMFIKEWFESDSKVTLITRPRRFGKSINLRLLRDFFDLASDICESRFYQQEIFTEHAEFCKKHHRKYPVILLDIKSVKGYSYDEIKNSLVYLMLTNLSFLAKKYELEKDFVEDIKEQFKTNQEFSTIYLRCMTKKLYDKYESKCIVLIDEYEVLLQDSFEKSYNEQTSELFSLTYGNVFNSNEYLEKGCLVGILGSFSKLYSSFNDIKYCSVVDKTFHNKFGFTHEEVKFLLKECDSQFNSSIINIDSLTKNYKGYLFGTSEESCYIYNPWSVLNSFIENRISDYWVSTGSERHLLNFIQKTSGDQIDKLKDFLTDFMNDEKEAKSYWIDKMNLSIVNNEKSYNTKQLMILLLHLGYLTINRDESNKEYLVIPNNEVFKELRNIYFKLVKQNCNDFLTYKARTIITHLKNLKLKEFAISLKDALLSSSFNDYDKNEKVYNMLMFCSILFTFDKTNEMVKSNRESDFCRYDVRFEANEGYSYFIFEHKVNKNLEKGVKEAMRKIKQKGFSLEDHHRTINIIYVGICFFKRKCLINYEFFQKINNEFILDESNSFITK